LGSIVERNGFNSEFDTGPGNRGYGIINGGILHRIPAARVFYLTPHLI
jgi:hypothetical protein